ncbi:LCP family protein [Candidatus Microgenomates bacterium]|nr:LCP family protein [Candidatus Microgenomates bacterium]
MKPIKLGVRRDSYHQKKSRLIIKKLAPFFLVLAILTALAIFLVTLSGSSMVKFILSGSSLRSSGGRVNVLILGMAGGRHEGATLTDTILVTSYNLDTNQLHLISIPRDLWLPSFSAKVNALYQIGLSQNNGLELAKIGIGNIVGLPVHYALRVDFQGFIDAINILGGIDVEVEKTFDDYLYPITGKENDLCGWEEKEMEFNDMEAKKLNIDPGKRKVFVKDDQIATDSAQEDKGIKYFSCRFEHIHFDKGLVRMDGEEALKFVRSRHGTNDEGSDFSRSKRQERVIGAVRKKALSFETLSTPTKLGELINSFGKSIDTDISIKDAVEFYKLSKRLAVTYSITLDDSKRAGLAEGRTSLLVQPSPSDYGGAYVLISQDDDFSIIHKFIQDVLKKDEEEHEATSSARTGSE